MAGIFSKLIDYMESAGWKYEILEGQTIVRFNFKASSGRLLCYGEVDEAKHWLLFYTYMPVNVPSDRIVDMAEFIVRANRGMRIGNFEFDFEDGEIRYKTSIDSEGGELTDKMIDNLLRANLSTINRYFPGIMELIYGGKSAIEAIAKIEAPMFLADFEDEYSDENDDDDENESDDDEEGEEKDSPFVSDDDDEEDRYS
jgi:hypothetical protein